MENLNLIFWQLIAAACFIVAVIYLINDYRSSRNHKKEVNMLKELVDEATKLLLKSTSVIKDLHNDIDQKDQQQRIFVESLREISKLFITEEKIPITFKSNEANELRNKFIVIREEHNSKIRDFVIAHISASSNDKDNFLSNLMDVLSKDKKDKEDSSGDDEQATPNNT